MNNQSTQERLHALDAVRGFALLLGIVLHGTMSFQPGLAAAGWPIIDQSQSYTLQIVFYVIHVFRMATFFLIAGFFARLVFYRRGPRTFIKDRSKRILLPLAGFYLPVAVATSAAVLWAVFKTYGSLASDSIPQQPLMRDPIIPVQLMHFWFLYVLVWLYALGLAVRWLVVKLDAQGGFRRLLDSAYAKLLNSHLAAPLLAIPVVLALYLIPNWWWWGGVPTPDQDLVPHAFSLFIYGYVFFLGWLLERQRHLLQSIRRYTAYHLLLGAAAVVVCLNIVGWKVNGIEIADPSWRLPYAVSYAVALISLSLAFIGGGMILFSRESPTIRYLADGSYWIYIMHIPIVFALQAWMMDWPLHWSLKFPLLMVLACIPLVLSYHWWVRATWIGKLMNGRRYPRQWPWSSQLSTQGIK